MAVEVLLPAYFLLLHLSFVSGTLTIYHGRVSQNDVSFSVVRGVTVLNLGSGVSHFFDCTTTEGTPNNLTWTKNEGSLRFSTTTENYSNMGMQFSSLRMDFAPEDAPFAGYNDVGGYTCTNTVSGEFLSINITGGNTVVNPVQASVEVILGSTAELGVYAAAEPPLLSYEIEWKRSDRTPLPTDRISLSDSHFQLVIRNVDLQDSGVYLIEVVREVAPVVFRVLASTTIFLDVHVIETETTTPEPEFTTIIETETTTPEPEFTTLETEATNSEPEYAPTIIITHEGMTQSSINETLQVTAEQGDLAPTFSCSADGSPPLTISWGGQDGGVTLPDEVSQTSNSQNQSLAWSRPLEYGDSGQYLCSAMNTAGSSAAALDLLVRNPPTIITISPTYPVCSTISTHFIVPQRYNGNVITCTALGWPTPTIEWHREGGNLKDGVTSVLTRDEGSAYVTAQLRWLDEFEESDSGEYTCMVRASDTDLISSETISFEISSIDSSIVAPATCTLNSQLAYFQIRVLETNCEMWGTELQLHISSNFETQLVNIVNTMCQDCNVSGNDLEVTGVATCGNQVIGGAVFRGMIDTLDQEQTQEIICTLSMWQRAGPLVFVDNDLHLVDKTLSLTNEESKTSEAVSLLGTHVGAAVGGVFLLMIAILCVVLCRLIHVHARGVVKKRVYSRPVIHEETSTTQVQSIPGTAQTRGGESENFSLDTHDKSVTWLKVGGKHQTWTVALQELSDVDTSTVTGDLSHR